MNEIQRAIAHLKAGLRAHPKRQSSPSFLSIVTPVWNTKPMWLAEAAVSLLEQSSPDWEWLLVDDCSVEREFHQLFPLLKSIPGVKVELLATPHGISEATNEGLRMATGRWVGFLDHDDLLTPDAVGEMTHALTSGWDVVYSDQDKIDKTGRIFEPFHKPEWSPEFFRGVMYVGHLLCLRRELAVEAGGFRKKFDGVQDFEFMLRVSERTDGIGHVDKILYHWRVSPGSVAGDGKAKPNIEKLQCEAVQEHLDRLGLKAKAIHVPPHGHRVQIIPRPAPHDAKISIVIPTRDAPELLDMCLSSLFAKSTYRNFEVVCMDNGTTDARALEVMTAYPVKRVVWPRKFNFSAVNNCGVNRATGEFLVFMNNDVEVRTPEWMEHLLYYASQDDVGAAGPLLVYPDLLVQHAGVVLGCRGTADHVMRGFAFDGDGYAGSLSCAREVSGVTAACLMVRRSLFEQVGGFNEHFFTAYQDVDLCLKFRALGKRNIFTPRAVMVHHESVSRGRYYDMVDRNLLLDLWEPEIERGDPYYNQHFDVQACDYRLRV